MHQSRRHGTLAEALRIAVLPLSLTLPMIAPATTALADEATGYSVGSSVQPADETGYYHRYRYPSRDFSGVEIPVEMREEDVAGMQVFVLSSSFDGDMSGRKKVLFVHGGAFVSQLSTEHLWFAANLAKATGAVIYLPSYPIANEYSDYSDTYPPMFELYKSISEQTPQERFLLMGDSAGAGLALGLCQLVDQTDGMQQPGLLMLISPWANVTVHAWDGLSDAAAAWAGGDARSQKTWQVSPTYGNMHGLNKVIIYNGEDDGLSESIEMLYRQLRGNNVDCQLVTTRNATHDYPYLLPRIEAIRTFNLICATITGRLSPQDNDMEWFETIQSISTFDNGWKSVSQAPKSISATPAYEGK